MSELARRMDRNSLDSVHRLSIELDVVETDLWAADGGPMRVMMSMVDGRAYYVADALERYERELRRSAGRQARGERLELEPANFSGSMEYVPHSESRSAQRASRKPSPAAPESASLALIEARAGSAHLLLEPLGQMVNLLASQGAVATVNALALTGAVNRVRVFFGRHITWRAEEGPTIGAIDAASAEPPNATFSLDDMGLQIHGGSLRKVVVLQQRADGTTNFVIADFDDQA